MEIIQDKKEHTAQTVEDMEQSTMSSLRICQTQYKVVTSHTRQMTPISNDPKPSTTKS